MQCHMIGLSLFLICALKAKDAVHWCVDIIREATYVFLCLATWCTKNWVINRRQQVIFIYIPFKLNAFKALEQTEEICFRLPLRYIDSFHAKWRQYGTVEPRYNEVARDWQNIFRSNEISLNRSTFPYVLLLLGWGKSFVIPRFSL